MKLDVMLWITLSNFIFLPILINAQEKYKQRRTLLPNSGLDLFWGVEFDRLYFKLVSKNAKHIAFVLSYNDIPTDGIIAGYDVEKNEFIHDLHLDFADFRANVYNLVPDAKENIKLEKIEHVGEFLSIEAFRELGNDEDLAQDLKLDKDLINIFYKVSTETIADAASGVSFDLGRTRDTGQAVITLLSLTDTTEDIRALDQFPSSDLRLTSGRPQPDGEARCQVLPVPRSASVLKGFTPILSGFNGYNGLVKSITLFSCDEKVSQEPRDCQAFLRDCHKVVFTWHPGTLGEVLALDLLLDSEALMLEVVYNPGTGWLKDSSGLRLHFSPEIPDPVRLGHRAVVVSRAEVKCDIRIHSVSLHSHHDIDPDLRLTRVTDEGQMTDIVSGYIREFQPTRRLVTPQEVSKNETLVLNCGSDDCFAVITYNVTEESTSANSCVDTDVSSFNVVYDIQDRNNTEKTTAKSTSSSTTTIQTTKSTKTRTFPSSTNTKTISTTTAKTARPTTTTIKTPPSSTLTRSTTITSTTASPKSVLISTTTTPLETLKPTATESTKSKPTTILSTNMLESIIIQNTTDQKLVPQSSKSNYDLVMAPRSLDDENKDFFRSTTAKETLNGQINFSNVYKSSSNFLKSRFILILSTIMSLLFSLS